MASQLIEEVTAHGQSDSHEDARETCADGTYFPNNLHTSEFLQTNCGLAVDSGVISGLMLHGFGILHMRIVWSTYGSHTHSNAENITL